MSSGYWSTVLTAHGKATEQAVPSASSRKRPPESPTLWSREDTPEKRIRRHSKGHAFAQITIKDNVRAHMGDYVVYGDVYNVSGNHYGSNQLGLGEPKDKTTQLIEWLQFPRQDARREQIQPAHRETFGWIYDEHATHVDFAEWLKSGYGFYSIYGKPASGKSTLMKMLSSDPRTHKLLQDWATGDSFILSSFYFWHTGTDMQRSKLGLLRSLLCDILTECPALGETAFPKWQRRFNVLQPTVEEVMSAFARVIDALPVKICFFLDGLDEYEGDEIH